MLKKLLCSLCFLTCACATAPAQGAEPCEPIEIAEAKLCVQEQLEDLRESNLYDETSNVSDNEDGTKTVTFVFDPKCLNDPKPCRVASHSVISVVNCKTGSATCPQ